MSAKKKALKEETTRKNLQWARDTLAEGKVVVLSNYMYKNKKLNHSWLKFDPETGLFLFSVRAANHEDFPRIGTNKRRMFAKEGLQYLCVLEESKDANGDPPLITMDPVIVIKAKPQAPKDKKEAPPKDKKEKELQDKKKAEELAFRKKHAEFIKQKNRQRAKRKKKKETGYQKGRSLRFQITSRYEFSRLCDMIDIFQA
jgi:hypothetical protein